MNFLKQTAIDGLAFLRSILVALKKIAVWKNVAVFMVLPVLFSLFFWVGLKPPLAQAQDIVVIYLLVFIFALISVLSVNFKEFRKFIFFQILPFLVIASEIINFELYSQFDAENAIRYGYTFALMGLLTDVGISWALNNWKLNRCSAVFSALWQLCLAALFVGVLARNIFGKSRVELDTVTAMYQTDLTEAVSYVAAHYSILFAIVFLVLICGAGIWLYLKLPKFRFSGNFVLKTVISIAGITMAFAGVAGIHKLYRKNKLWLFSILNKGGAFRQELVIFNQEAAKRRTIALTPDESKLVSTKGNNGRFILVLGESNSRDYMGCYGYKQNTTPFLSRMRSDARFTFFEQSFSNHVHTTEALKYLLTEQNQYNGKEKLGVTLYDVARYCGYTSSFISNQYVYDCFRSPVSAISQAADRINYLNTEMDFVVRKNRLDIETVKALKELPAAPRELIVIHLMSCHAPYQVRYPAEFRRDLALRYEKATAYLDYVLQEIFEYAMKDDSVAGVLFVPDHGEDVVLGDHDSAIFTPDMTRIPLICYLNENYRKANPALSDSLKSASGKIFTNDLVFDLMLDLMGISSSFNPPELHVLSAKYNINMNNGRTMHGRADLNGNILRAK